MGDRYKLILNCAYCNKQNTDIWYAPTSSSDTFKCSHCKKTNFVTSILKAIKIEDATLNMV